MTRQVLYVAAPLRPTEEEIAAVVASLAVAGQTSVDHVLTAMRRNIDRAMRWLAWLRKSFPETTFIAPWIAEVLSSGGSEDREAGMMDNCAVIERCDGIVLCGGRISEGMRREMEHGLRRGLDDSCEPHIQTFVVYDLTGYSADPPGVFEPDDDGAHREFTANATARTREDAERLWRLGRKT